MPLDLDLEVGVEAAGDRVRAAGIDDAEAPRGRRGAGEVVQALIQVSHRRRRKIDDLGSRVLALGDGHQTSAFSHA